MLANAPKVAHIDSVFVRYKGHQNIRNGSPLTRAIEETAVGPKGDLRGPRLAGRWVRQRHALLHAFWDLRINIVVAFCPLSQLTTLNTTEIDIFTLQRLHTAVARILSISSAFLLHIAELDSREGDGISRLSSERVMETEKCNTATNGVDLWYADDIDLLAEKITHWPTTLEVKDLG